jgi:tRNA/rRNA methyltransferase
VGRHIPDFVSFTKRVAIELVNADETEVIAKDRAARKEWLEARGYRVECMKVADVERDLAGKLDRLAIVLTASENPTSATQEPPRD